MAYIGIDRGIRNHWIYKDSQYFHVWFEMLHVARFSKEPKKELYEKQLVEIRHAEFIFGRKMWSERLGISEQKLRTLVKKMIDEGMIELTSKFNKFSLYRIKNYEKYNQQSNQQDNQHDNQQEDQAHQEVEDNANQQSNQQDNQHNNQQPTSSQPAGNQQITTKEERSNKDNKDLKYIVEYLNECSGKNFRFSNKETQKLIHARLDEGYTRSDFKQVIDTKIKEWAGTDKEQYIRPSTLFRPSNFESYLNQKTNVVAIDKQKEFMQEQMKARERQYEPTWGAR